MKSRNNTKSKLTIEKIVKDNLCTGCGSCVATCPKGAITMPKFDVLGVYRPCLDREKCNKCGICYNVCPGYSVDLKTLNEKLFSKEPDDKLIGNYRNCYVGHTTNYDLRYNATSGGAVTQYLIYALEEGIIDGALVVRMKKGTPFESEPFIARTRQEIIEASGSKYCPVPTNIALKEIMDADENERFAVVGLPCHINGIRKAQSIIPGLKRKIVLSMGLFCAKTISFLGTGYVLKQLNIEPSMVTHIDYRGNGWPGEMKIQLDDGCVRTVKLHDYYDHRFAMFAPLRCRLCNDHAAEFSDISFGDAWLPEFKDDKVGESIIVTRTRLSEEILEKMIYLDIIEGEKIHRDKVIQSQGMFRDKKEGLVVRRFVLKMFGRSVPVQGYEASSIKVGKILVEARAFLWSFIARTQYFESFLGFREFAIKVRKYLKPN